MKVVIAGGGSVGLSIARELLRHHHSVLIIDENEIPSDRDGFEAASWYVGDACEMATLKLAGVEEADVVVSATGDDKANLVVSLLAKTEFGVGRTVGRVNNPKNDWMFDDAWGVDVAVSTPRLMTALVEEAVEVGDVVRLLTLRTGETTMVAYTVPFDGAPVGRLVGSYRWPDGVVPVAVLRDDIPFAPSPDDVFEGDDEVFFLTAMDAEPALRELLAARA
ncbi:potassium channel family protein [Galactobacter caseinivorans]|uniref:Trk system potassium uptake protein TrkA n=1 Tax=Galactobacter caseinivorans TaxID=2676123 RepID=A0A496PMF8_9MICC|nr:TrkA family potassium uptake protein [Galactobacter caseinivorans]RKW71718.1 TrkA family potassium uptake protein [Galactobacter caseinivorans]